MILKLSLCTGKQALHRIKNKWSLKTPGNISDLQKTQDDFLVENPTQQWFVLLGRTDSWLVLTALNTEYCWITVSLTGSLKAVRKPIFLVLRLYLIQMSCRKWQTRIACIIKIIRLSRTQNAEAQNGPFHPWQLLFVIHFRTEVMKSQIICLHRAVQVFKPISVYKCNWKITPFSSGTAVLLLEGLLCWFGNVLLNYFLWNYWKKAFYM